MQRRVHEVANHPAKAAIPSDLTSRQRPLNGQRALPWDQHVLCCLLLLAAFVVPRIFINLLIYERSLSDCSQQQPVPRKYSEAELVGLGFGNETFEKVKREGMRAGEPLTDEVPEVVAPLSAAEPAGRELPAEMSVSRKPMFYLHVGLPKTGTTFLQCALCADSNHTNIFLQQDRFIYLGTCPYQFCGIPSQADSFFTSWLPTFFYNKKINVKERQDSVGPVPHTNVSHEDVGTLPMLGNVFVERVNNARKTGFDAMVIFEGLHILSSRHIHALANFLLPDWDVQILVAYRPFYDWLPSKYNSLIKPNRSPVARAWPGLSYVDPRQPDVPFVGAPIASLDFEALADPTNNSSFANMLHDVMLYQQHPAQMVRDNYRRYFTNVDIVPLHQIDVLQQGAGDPLLNLLFCQHVLRRPTPHSCQAVKDKQIGSADRTNPSKELDYDMLAVAAYERGLFQFDERRPSTKRGMVTEAIRKQQEDVHLKTSKDWPQICFPESTMQTIEALSLKLEKRLFMDSWTEDMAREHHLGFERKKSVYCHVDTDKVLATKMWQQFFRSISGNEKKI
jgi:hypothetical protein